ncbi:MAG TPA: hypothetical protein VKD90_12335 [Gemmataceae bacterium]|nr:hypothetical protein [Gemmataceae bacterium]
MKFQQLRFGATRNSPVRGAPIGPAPAPSRRHFLRSAAGAAGLLLAANASTARADGDCPPPVPIPGGLDFFGDGSVFHVYAHGYPGFGGDPGEEDPSVIYNINADVGVAYVRGMGTHTDKASGVQTHLPWEIDLRFAKGEYVGADGKRHNGAFALV